MKRLVDFSRLIFISPEIVAVLLPLLVFIYAPSWADVLIKPIKEGLAFGLGAAAIPLAMLAFNYKEGFDLLSPAGNRKVLLEWPDYPNLKARVIAAFGWCIAGTCAGFVGVWMAFSDVMPRLGIAILVAGILAAAMSTATIGLARLRLRELLGE